VQAEGRLSSGDFAGAERLAKRLIDDRARLLSEETLLTAYGLLGTARVARGDGVAAMEPLKRGLELQSRLHGVGDPRYLVNLGVLGEAFLAINKLDLAEQYLRESASGLRIIFGRNDLLYAGPLVPLGNLSLARGHAPEAESLFHEAMSIFEQLHTNEPIVPRCIDDLAQFYISQGEYVAANDSLRQALWKAETCLCDDHPKLAEILEHQAFVMRKLNRPAEAEAAETRAKSVRARFADRVARDAKSDSLEP
jgi:tetratricopeptide (TPR) repeat protein